jgi:hypothetical protein
LAVGAVASAVCVEGVTGRVVVRLHAVAERVFERGVRW